MPKKHIAISALDRMHVSGTSSSVEFPFRSGKHLYDEREKRGACGSMRARHLARWRSAPPENLLCAGRYVCHRPEMLKEESAL